MTDREDAVADWKTYAKAAQNTARKQAPDLARQARSSTKRSTQRAGAYARAAGKAADEGTRASRTRARRDAAAYATVASRRVKEANIGRRLVAAFRDAVLMGLSLLIIWFVVTRTGVQIPVQAVGIVVLLLMVLRFGWVLIDSFRSHDEEEIADEILAPTPEETHEPRRRHDHA